MIKEALRRRPGSDESVSIVVLKNIEAAVIRGPREYQQRAGVAPALRREGIGRFGRCIKKEWDSMMGAEVEELEELGVDLAALQIGISAFLRIQRDGRERERKRAGRREESGRRGGRRVREGVRMWMWGDEGKEHGNVASPATPGSEPRLPLRDADPASAAMSTDGALAGRRAHPLAGQTRCKTRDWYCWAWSMQPASEYQAKASKATARPVAIFRDSENVGVAHTILYPQSPSLRLVQAQIQRCPVIDWRMHGLQCEGRRASFKLASGARMRSPFEPAMRRAVGLHAVPVTGTAVVSTGVQRERPVTQRSVVWANRMSTARDG
ncbi:hypothetical protein B0H19DRAFT_1071036 [Mycena capillaripes]|nr:hypothetical protein B0H19DRAFT_1071036 [Mycena capillaripes]